MEVINFLAFYTCSFKSNIFLLLLLIIAATWVTFHFLGTTCENYLAPALSVLAEKFRFSEALAGVTLVALANGAPDIITAFAAGGSSSDTGIYTALGAIFGANLFTTTIILAGCIVAASGLKSEAFGTTRDLVFFIIASLFVLSLGFSRQITFPGAIGYFSVYGIFLIFVLFGEYKIRKKEREAVQRQSDVFASTLVNFGDQGEDEEINMLNYLKENHYFQMDECGESPLTVQKFNAKNPGKLKWIYLRTKHMLHVKYLRQKKWSDRTVFEKVLFIYEFPIDFIRDFSIPCVDDSRWNRRIAPFNPFFGSLVIIWQFDLFRYFNDLPGLWVLLIIFCTGFGLYIWKISHTHRMPDSLALVFSIIAFVVSVLWVNLMASIFQDVLFMVQIISGLPSAYLGLTLLAWGNSVSDFFVDFSLSRQGYAQMAVSGVFAGQLFNLLVGFGGTLVRATMREGSIKFDLLDGSAINDLNLGIIAFALVSFIFQLVYVWMRKFSFGKRYARFVVGYYMLFFVFVSVYSLSQALQG